MSHFTSTISIANARARSLAWRLAMGGVPVRIVRFPLGRRGFMLMAQYPGEFSLSQAVQS